MIVAEYFIQEQHLSRVTRTIIKDEKGTDIFLMIGRWGSRGDVLTLYGMNGNLLARIKQTSFSFGTRFELYDGFEKVGVMQKIFNWPGDFYYIQQLHWTAQGNIFQHEYTIHHFRELIMEMNHAHLFSGDYYVVNIPKPENAPICICIAAVLDYWLYNRQTQKKPPFSLSFTCDY